MALNDETQELSKRLIVLALVSNCKSLVIFAGNRGQG
jgi:hypothetical protein